jgi:small neutral amino acid transporter SnatA (MarC family)
MQTEIQPQSIRTLERKQTVLVVLICSFVAAEMVFRMSQGILYILGQSATEVFNKVRTTH